MGDWIPYDEMPEVTDPESGYVVTANNRIEPEGFEHHITSDYFDGFRATRIEQMLEAEEVHDLDTFARMQTDMRSLPGLETAHRLSRLRPRDQTETSAIERLRSWDGLMDRDSIAASIYQAFTLRFARELARAVIGDRDLAERWLDRAHNGFMAHVSSPWRWQAHMLALWEEGDEELIGRPWEGLALDSLRGALTDLAHRFGDDPADWRWGRVHELHFPHALGAANPALGWLLNRSLEVGGGQETVCQVGWDPNDPVRGDLGAVLADGRRPLRARGLPLAAVHGELRASRQLQLRRPSAALARRSDAAFRRRGALEDAACWMRAREPPRTDHPRAATSSSSCSSPPESSIVSTIGPRGWPHSMPMWFTLREPEGDSAARRAAAASSGAGPTPSRRRPATSNATPGRPC